MNGGTKVMPSRGLLDGFKYVNADHTDLRATFAKARAALGIAQPKPASKPRKRS